MTRLLLAVALLLTACTDPKVQTALTTPAGRLFCSIQTAGGGAFVATLVATSLSSQAPGAGPLVVIAADAGKAAVDADCAKAAATVGGVSGVAVSPPVGDPVVPNVAIVAPASPVKAL